MRFIFIVYESMTLTLCMMKVPQSRSGDSFSLPDILAPEDGTAAVKPEIRHPIEAWECRA